MSIPRLEALPPGTAFSDGSFDTALIAQFVREAHHGSLLPAAPPVAGAGAGGPPAAFPGSLFDLPASFPDGFFGQPGPSKPEDTGLSGGYAGSSPAGPPPVHPTVIGPPPETKPARDSDSIHSKATAGEFGEPPLEPSVLRRHESHLPGSVRIIPKIPCPPA